MDMESLMNLDTLKNLSPEQQAQVIEGLQKQAAIANAQSLITDLSDKCTTKCITSPGSSLTGSDQQCLQRCMDRFMDTWNLVSNTLQQRLQQEYAKGPSFGSGPTFQ
ncbi:hypothetical protein QR680_009372 [Steinernema hermaphroditum]|uniref:Mitochondrial import inner membrane translocase subunit n=1 Tax=Steinernema hermaphroditum TaxID=289476 RepID=A0AA39IK04_9BILA|nr:hypothetical protein QR680_009372 [Steinernema hermaphroditum]